jgi:hypothetical protein
VNLQALGKVASERVLCGPWLSALSASGQATMSVHLAGEPLITARTRTPRPVAWCILFKRSAGRRCGVAVQHDDALKNGIYGWRLAGEGADDELSRCADLIPVTMRRRSCGLGEAIGYVIDALRPAATTSDVFVMRAGYAKPWAAAKLPSPAKSWRTGMPVPEGFKASHWIDNNATNPAQWTRYGIRWVGKGPEPERFESLADQWDRLQAAWSRLEPTGNIDATPGDPSQWWSAIAVRRRVAEEVGLLRRPEQCVVAIVAGRATSAHDRSAPSTETHPQAPWPAERLATRIREIEGDHAKRLLAVAAESGLASTAISELLAEWWTGEKLLLRRAELLQLTPKVKAPTKELVKETGLNERTIQRLEKKARSALSGASSKRASTRESGPSIATAWSTPSAGTGSTRPKS